MDRYQPESGSMTFDDRCNIVLRYALNMVRKLKTAIRFLLMAYVAYGIIYQFPC
jgi:hypothetical protein